MKRIIDLMRVDIIALGVKRKLAFTVTAVLFVICLMLLILCAPCFGASLSLFFFIICIPSAIIGQEIKSDYGKTFCILPVDRKSVVLARFLLTTLLHSGIGILMYLLMRLSMAVGLSAQIMGDIGELLDFLGIPVSVSELNNVVFSAVFTAGLIIMSNQMRNYFKNGAVSQKNSLLRGVLKAIAVYILLISAGTVLMSASSIPFIQTAFSLIFMILLALSNPADGILLCLTFLAAGYGTAAYQAVCAVLEYDEREL